MKIIKKDHHRNGVSGEPFEVAIVEENGERMLVVMFPEKCHTAAFNIDLLAKGDIEFGSNSYRGDYFESALRNQLYPKTDNE